MPRTKRITFSAEKTDEVEEEVELIALAEFAGFIIKPDVFRHIMALLQMNVSPGAIIQMLKAMERTRKHHQKASSRNT